MCLACLLLPNDPPPFPQDLKLVCLHRPTPKSVIFPAEATPLSLDRSIRCESGQWETRTCIWKAGSNDQGVIPTAPLHASALLSSPCMHRPYLMQHLCQPALTAGVLGEAILPTQEQSFSCRRVTPYRKREGLSAKHQENRLVTAGKYQVNEWTERHPEFGCSTSFANIWK